MSIRRCRCPRHRARRRYGLRALVAWASLLAISWTSPAPWSFPPAIAHARQPAPDPPGFTPVYGRPEITEPPSIHPEDPWRLAVGDRVFFPVGHYGGSLTSTSSDWRGDIEAMNRAFIDTLAEHGLNYARAWVNWGGLATRRDDWNAHTAHPWVRVSAGGGERSGEGAAATGARAIDGGALFDLTRFADRHFDLIAAALDHARHRGIVLQLVVFDCWHLEDRPGGRGDPPSGVAYDPLHPRNNASGVAVRTPEQWVDPAGPAFETHARYVRELVGRVGDRPNLIWEACNENSTNYPAFDLAIAELLTATERELGLAPHLVMPRDLPDHRRVAGHFTPAGDRPHLEQSLAEMRKLLVEQREWRQPLISDNDCCRDRARPAFRRRKLWTALSAGAHVDFFVAGLPHERSLHESQDIERGMAFFGYALRFFEGARVDLVDLQPCAAGGDGWVLCREPDGGAAERPAEWIAYLPEGGRVRLPRLPPERRACWFDPREGFFRAAAGGPVYQAPSARDWVLHVSAGAGAPCRAGSEEAEGGR
ncbi:MAG TPA: hypothetical protein VMT85_13715 [Thermoanaerobaculia bacterium]|nr:hypothetical protein [Thermoanaerobaculia bacterium]